jgi:hypothetical protein
MYVCMYVCMIYIYWAITRPWRLKKLASHDARCRSNLAAVEEGEGPLTDSAEGGTGLPATRSRLYMRCLGWDKDWPHFVFICICPSSQSGSASRWRKKGISAWSTTTAVSKIVGFPTTHVLWHMAGSIFFVCALMRSRGYRRSRDTVSPKLRSKSQIWRGPPKVMIIAERGTHFHKEPYIVHLGRYATHSLKLRKSMIIAERGVHFKWSHHKCGHSHKSDSLLWFLPNACKTQWKSMNSGDPAAATR